MNGLRSNRKPLILTGIVLGFVFTARSIGQVPGNQLFDNSIIHQIRIISVYEGLIDSLAANYVQSFGMYQFQIRPIPYAPAKLVVDGTVLDTLGIRYKGFNSWWHSVKKPIKIDINKYKPGQEYDGLKKFNLHNGSGDPSFIRENIDYKILRSTGIKAPRTSYAQVYLDTAYLGLYRIVEQVDNTFLDVNFGNHQGNLYVQEAKGTAGFSLGWEGPGQEEYYESISLENHQAENDWSGFIHFLDVLNNTPDKNFRDSILTVFDVEEYLQVLAFDIAVNNLDFYGNSGRNFYLYSHNGIFHWIPWDYNLTWLEGKPALYIEPSGSQLLIRRILEIPEFYEVYLRKYCLLKSYFTESYIGKLVDGEAAMISDYLRNDPYQDYPYEAFLMNRDTSWSRIPGLKPYAKERYADIVNTLETLRVDCNQSSELPGRINNILRLYPVPAREWIYIDLFPGKEVSVSIVNSFGQVVRSTNFFEEGRMNVSGLSAGCYIVRVIDSEMVYTKLLLVEN